MRKAEINSKLRAYAKEVLSPKNDERTLVAKVYESVCAVLGDGNCLQIGSYPRFTAITPLHDLDVLYILGSWSLDADPSGALKELASSLEADYENPTNHRIAISTQTHSVTISFIQGAEEVFAVDIVPAYMHGRNEFDGDLYMVPEVVTKSRAERRIRMEESLREGETINWIASDPRGYIAVARTVNDRNADFRKAVKIVKAWRASCKEDDKEFPLKSFHLEQIITQFFERVPESDIFDSVFYFFYDLPFQLREPRHPDRADSERYLDDYVADIDAEQMRKIREARDHFLISLENITSETDMGDIVNVGYRRRASSTEQYLFDKGIPVLTEVEFDIVAHVQQRQGGFRAYILDAIGVIAVDRKINFRLGSDAPQADLFKWKVKNDDKSPEPRGEITNNSTKNDPEHTKYTGRHFVECFAIKDAICIGRSRQNVILRNK